MTPLISTFSEKRLIGKRITTSLSENRTAELWKGFMPRRKEIKNALGTELFSIQVYAKSFDFKDFNRNTVFEKWATVEVKNFDEIPDEMEAYVLPGGLYAMFIHKGSSTDNRTFQYIFTTWLPNSNYELDDRPHFEILGEKYKSNDSSSEEEIWIPIKGKL